MINVFIGRSYIPMQYFGKPVQSDFDGVIKTNYGKFHVVVKDYIIIKHELVKDE